MAIVAVGESANGAPTAAEALEQGEDAGCASSAEELCLGESFGIGYGAAGGPATTG